MQTKLKERIKQKTILREKSRTLPFGHYHIVILYRRHVRIYAVMALCRVTCFSGVGVSRQCKLGSGIREAIQSGTRSGETDRTGYSVAGVARSSREVAG